MRDGNDERIGGTAAQALLDHGWGKAKAEAVTSAEGSYHYHQKPTKPSNPVNEHSDGWFGPLVAPTFISKPVGAFLRPYKKKADNGGYGAKGVHFALQAIISMTRLTPAHGPILTPSLTPLSDSIWSIKTVTSYHT